MNQRAGMSFKLFHSLALALVFLRPTGPQRPRLDELASRDEIELDLHSPRWILIQTAMAEEREQTLLTIGKGLSALPLHQRKTSAPKLGKTQAHNTKEPLLASQACTQCNATKDNRRAIIHTALDAEAILRAGTLLFPLQPAYEPLHDAGNAGVRQLDSRK